ncbi:tyrosine-protein kinase SRK3-like [Apostichopus japonicus]|uniref:tyrosine-protein kinase SRK3-like n=1 Tax=Stichopus japonicus TaxID=307972 RepID=UPI003AB18474
MNFYQDYEETASKDDRSLAVTNRIKLRSNYQVWIRARVFLPPSYGVGAEQDGNLAMLEFNTSPPISSSTTTAFQTTRRITPTLKTTTTWPTEVYVVLAAFALLTPVVIMAIVILICRSSNRKTPRFENRPLHLTRKKENVIISPEFQTHEIFHVFDVILGDPIGQGQFGEVYIAKWRQKKGDNEEITVAVKTTKENLKPALKEQFLDEIRLMIEIGNHPNIMAILGCRTVAEPYYLIIEYMKYGSLKEYLTKSNDVELVMKDQSYDLTEIRQLQISHQISKGMEYLESQKFFHGDLAARNILLGEHLEVKISDFGFANNIYETGYARLPEESKRPVKWYSPEALLTGKCSSAGDVWSFGVVLYEIYSRGEEPYIGMLPREVLTRLLAGYRMDKPEDCSQHIYELMLDCWEKEPSARPVFHDIKKTLEGFLANISGDAYIDLLNGDHSDDDDQETVSGINVT